jgi:hypothetical protein
MFACPVQVIEFRCMFDMLLNDEDGFPDGKCLIKHTLTFNERNGHILQNKLPGDTNAVVFRG